MSKPNSLETLQQAVDAFALFGDRPVGFTCHTNSGWLIINTERAFYSFKDGVPFYLYAKLPFASYSLALVTLLRAGK